MDICLSNLFFLRQNNLKLAVNLLIAGIITVGNARAELPLRINEIMAANSNTLADEDGDYPDWIELFNTGQASLNLSSYALSDAAGNPTKWFLPEVSLAPQKFIIVFASDKDRHGCIPYWQALIAPGEVWRYKVGTAEPPADWYQADFDDAGWASGASGFGYGDGDDNTILPDGTLSVYIRKSFTINNREAVRALRLHVDYDDAFIAYLNGVEVARANISGEFPPYNQSADTYTEPRICYGGYPEAFELDSLLNLLQEGANVLAVQVHNSGSSSSDLTLIPFLSAGMTEQPSNSVSPDTILQLKSIYPHANFKISAGGETLYLFDQQSQEVDSVNAGSLANDISIGRYPDGSSHWLYYANASPAAANTSDGYEQIGGAVTFSIDAGFYSQPQTLILTSNQSNAAIHYTLNGNEPTDSSPLYTAPLPISQTTVVRARCTGSGITAGPIATNTYIIGRQPNLAVISLTTAPANLWDPDSGIYVLGPNASSELPYYGANFWQDWEKPVHVEFFEPDGVQGFELEAGLQIFGGWSRACAQKPLAIFARGKYGTSEINYRIFPDLAIDKFESFLLRNSANDWQYTMFRDAFMQFLVRGSAIDLQGYRPAVVYLNGEYWGILNIREKLNEHYVAAHHGIDSDHLDLLENQNNPIAGEAIRYNQFYSFIQNNDLSLAENYDYILTQMDIDNFIDYELAEIYFDNQDWPGNNLKYWCERSENGRWRWILFDTDFGFGLYDVNKYQNNTLEFATATNGPDWPNPPWSTLILRKLLESEDFKVRFINRAADYLNVNFEAARVNQQIDYFYNLLSREMPYHLARWQTDLGWSNINTWKSQIGNLRTFANNRPLYFTMYLNEKFGLRGRAKVTVHTTPAAGRVRLNRVYIEDDEWGGYYFLDVPIEVEALPRPGYRFAGWSGTYTSTENPLTITPNEAWNLTANFVPDSTNQRIVINEINYHSSTEFNPGEWVELLNNSTNRVDISGWTFKDSNNDQGFPVSEGTTLDPGGFWILCGDTNLFRGCFPDVRNVSGNFGFNLNNSGEFIRLFDQFGELIDSVYYGDESPWPEAPDGNGPTLALINPDEDNNVPNNWKSGPSHGTPGLPNTSAGHIPENNIVVDDCRLGIVYPNPFNCACTIPLAIDGGEQRIRMSVFNLKGGLVAIIFDGVLKPGEYNFKWQPQDGFTSGIYLYRVLDESGKTKTGKMLFLK